MKSNARALRVVCVTKRWDHHTPSGGYDRLAAYLRSVEVRRPYLTSSAGRVAEKAWSFLIGEKPHLLKYRFEDRLAEEKAFWIACCRRAQIVHVFYGDEQMDTLLRRANLLPGRLVATFHLPLSLTRGRIGKAQRDLVRHLAGAFVVASSEVAELAAILGDEKVAYVPHGIDTGAFTPGPGNARGPLRLIFVGLHMRDFEVAHKVADRCAREAVDIVIDVVLPPDKHAFFTGCGNIRRHSRISEAQLIALYQQADAMFLPLLGGTANNAILESLACGTPVITTDVGGIPDYVDDSCGWLLPIGDADAAFECIRQLADDPTLARHMRRAARAKADSFSWERVATQISDGYERLAATGRLAA